MPTLIDASILSVAITLGAEITLVLDVDSVADRKASNWRLRPTRALAVSEIPPDAAPAAPTAPGAHVSANENANARPIGIGDLLPHRSLATLDGQHFELLHAVAPQRLTVLVFLSPWCESYLAASKPETAANCRNVREQFTALAADPRVRWLGIASGLWANSEDLRKYRTENKVPIPLTLDASGDVFRAFRVNEVPTVLVADAGGRIVRRIEGSAAHDAAALRAAVDGS